MVVVVAATRVVLLVVVVLGRFSAQAPAPPPSTITATSGMSQRLRRKSARGIRTYFPSIMLQQQEQPNDKFP
jgi:hypothetical protein